jgi:hypothetical protein
VTFAVMELLEGETLRNRLQRAALPWRKAAEIGLASKPELWLAEFSRP